MSGKEAIAELIEFAISQARALPGSREAALTVTKLEEAQMWLERVA